MSKYTHTDKDGTELEVSPSLRGGVYLDLETKHDIIATTIPTEDAPAVALAILEAAGIQPSIAAFDESAELFEARAVNDLQRGQAARRRADAIRARDAEREAEDAKVRAFLDSIGATPARIEDHHRKLYRAAHNHFQQGGTLPAPGFIADKPRTVERVEDLTDAHRRCEWVDTDGLIWSYDYKAGNWGYRTPNGRYRNVDVPCDFPWTEVTK